MRMCIQHVHVSHTYINTFTPARAYVYVNRGTGGDEEYEHRSDMERYVCTGDPYMYTGEQVRMRSKMRMRSKNPCPVDEQRTHRHCINKHFF